MIETISMNGVYIVSWLTTLHWITSKGDHPWEKLIFHLLAVNKKLLAVFCLGVGSCEIPSFCVSMSFDTAMVPVLFMQPPRRDCYTAVFLVFWLLGSSCCSSVMFPET